MKKGTGAKPKANVHLKPALQPLRIPSGWVVSYNSFREVDADFKTYDDTSWYFNEDMLQIEFRHGAVLIDLGWYPSARTRGHFVLKAVRLFPDMENPPYDPWRRPLKSLKTRSRRKVVMAIEEWLAWYSEQSMHRR
jgi:hypothetical protein